MSTSALCRRCKAPFDLRLNTPTSCRFHPEWYSGETAQRWQQPGEQHDLRGGAVLYFWACCGEADPRHPGCVAGPHVSFDEAMTYEGKR